MKVPALTIFLFLGILSVSAAPVKEDECSWPVVEKLVFDTSLSEFHKHRKAQDPKGCDWNSDGCTWAPEKPLGINFGLACMRHDFAYRNAENLKKFTDENKEKFDDQQAGDLTELCSGSILYWDCLKFAGAYYLGASWFGEG